MDVVAVAVGGMLLCLVLLFMFSRVCCQQEDPNQEEEDRRTRWRSREPAIPAPPEVHPLTTYVPWTPARLFPKLFNASVHPYLLPSMPFRSVVATSSSRNDVEPPLQAPVFSEGAGRKPKSSVAAKCRLRATVPLAARGLSTRPHVPPLPRPARKFPPTEATLTESAVRRLADLPLAPVHYFPRESTSEARRRPDMAPQLPAQALLSVRQARTRAWVLSQIKMQTEVEMVPAVAPSALGCEACCDGLQLLKEWTKESGQLPEEPQQEAVVQMEEEKEEEEQRTAM